MTRLELHQAYLRNISKGTTEQRRSRKWRRQHRKLHFMLEPFSRRRMGHYRNDHYIEINGVAHEATNLLQWCLGLDKTRRVAEDTLGQAWISTVWLGLEHFGGMLYETMVFWDGNAEEQWRYRTREEALAGHQEALAYVRGKMN